MKIIRPQVEKAYAFLYRPAEGLFTDPVFGGDHPDKDLAALMAEAERAFIAREYWSVFGPDDAPPLPLHAREWDKQKYRSPFLYLWVNFAKSLCHNNLWEITSHPDFVAYARGVMASPYAAAHIRNDIAMRKQYPPQTLHYIVPGMHWAREPDELR